MIVRIKKLHPMAQIPEYATIGSAGADVFPTWLEYDRDHNRIIYHTGLAFELPRDYELQVRARSGLTKTLWSMPHGIGTIDSDYRGELLVVFTPRSEMTGLVDMKPPYNLGEAVAQLILAPVLQANFEESPELTQTDRGEGGFGSTTGKVKLNLPKTRAKKEKE